MDEQNENLLAELSQADVDAMGDELFDGWDDDSITADGEETPEEESEETGEPAEDEDESESADQTEEEPEDEAEETDNPETDGEPDKKADETSQQTYHFTHLDDDPLDLTPEQMVPYVQKGLDYDRIRQERDAMKGNYSRYEMYADFLDRIKGKFESIEALMDDTDATLLVKNEADNGRTMTKEDALKKVKANREEKYKSIVPPKTADKKGSEDDPQMSEVKAFTQMFKQIFPKETIPKWEELPAEVQQEFEKTGKLTAPYISWRMNQKENEIKTIKNNQKNKEKSTGSRRSKGKSAAIDPIFEGFGDE